MIKGSVLVHQEISYFFQKKGLEGNLNSLNTNPYRALPLFKGIDKRVNVDQIRSLKPNTIRNGSQLKLTSRLTLKGCHFRQG